MGDAFRRLGEQEEARKGVTDEIEARMDEDVEVPRLATKSPAELAYDLDSSTRQLTAALASLAKVEKDVEFETLPARFLTLGEHEAAAAKARKERIDPAWGEVGGAAAQASALVRDTEKLLSAHSRPELNDSDLARANALRPFVHDQIGSLQDFAAVLGRALVDNDRPTLFCLLHMRELPQEPASAATTQTKMRINEMLTEARVRLTPNRLGRVRELVGHLKGAIKLADERVKPRALELETEAARQSGRYRF
jgi:hypothetical protein